MPGGSTMLQRALSQTGENNIIRATYCCFVTVVCMREVMTRTVLGLLVLLLFALTEQSSAEQVPAGASSMPPEPTTISSAASVPVADNPSPVTSSTASSQAPVEYSPVPGLPADAPRTYYTYHTPFEFYLTLLSVGLLLVALVVLSAMAWKTGLTADYTRTFVIVVIVFAALFLISAGYSDQQAAPVYGLLGTIAGYIFGKMPSGDGKKEGEAEPGPVAEGEPAQPQPQVQP